MVVLKIRNYNIYIYDILYIYNMKTLIMFISIYMCIHMILKHVLKNKKQQTHVHAYVHIRTLAHAHMDVCTYSSTMDDLGTTRKYVACYQ
jgi:hypothetical protein